LANEGEIRDAAGPSGFKVRGCLGVLVEAVKRVYLHGKQSKILKI
jgi:predicted nucleic acid-binding protein